MLNYAVTRNDLAREAVDQFKKASARIIGVVLNQVKMDSGNHKYYYYYYSRTDDEQKKH
ncbi:MAG: CpsD/CapB family tyrosine-protein kinase [Syntrophomonadaceae bacterium]|nr:CpsD/CapB family tyrosine-protein kinase [Syntrophomonadaceae bacterium]